MNSLYLLVVVALFGQSAATSVESESPPEEIGKYNIRELLGTGGFCTVYRGLDSISGAVVAIRICDYSPKENGEQVPESGEDLEKSLLDECELHRSLNHPHVLRLIDCFSDNIRFVFFITEFMPNGDLAQMLAGTKEHRLSPETARGIFRQIALAVKYLHKEKSVLHKDLKPDNFLFGDKGLVVADFGSSEKLEGARGWLTNDPIGTLRYMAPERFAEPHEYGFKSDVFSLGVILYEMLVGGSPFRGLSLVKPKIIEKRLKDADVPVKAVLLILNMLEADPEKRYSIDEVVDSEWLMELRRQERRYGELFRANSRKAVFQRPGGMIRSQSVNNQQLKIPLMRRFASERRDIDFKEQPEDGERPESPVGSSPHRFRLKNEPMDK